jgi:hypothetical protein
MAPATTAPAMTPAAIPGPHPHPRQADASVAGAATITTIVAAPSKLTMVFFINVSLGLAGAERATRDSSDNPECTSGNLRSGARRLCGETTADLTELIGPKNESDCHSTESNIARG